MLIHPVYGMWHAYRAALLLAEEIPLAPAAELDHPCHTCVAKPCLTACPAAALSEEGYDVASCRRQLVSASEPACLKHGCLARWACPIGVAYAQDDEQAAYHARVFAGQRAVLSDRSACRD
jgi:epoxyqueuosine reductase QueG